MTRDVSLPPCERFTVLDSRGGETVSQCDVCDEYEVAHPDVGRRTLSGGEVEELRRRMIIAAYDVLEAQGPTEESDSPLERPPVRSTEDKA
ncbi:MAG: hypothetical protein ABI186_00525 [Candidatus Elarobacter sp.]